MTELAVVGKSITRIDAVEKVTGAAKYSIDEGLGLSNMLCGKVLFSPYPHAKIVDINTSRAEQLPGVRAVVTGKDVPPFRAGGLVSDRHVLCRDKVRFVGDAVAAVAATDMDIAEEALDSIRVEYEELPAVFDAEEAMMPDCPVVLHPDFTSYNRPVYAYLGLDLPAPNVHTHHKVRRGNVDDAFRRADLVVENRFSNARIAHCQLEPYNAVAYVRSDGSLTIWTSVHLTFLTAGEICSAFGLPSSKVRIKSSYMGGNFGAGARPERFAALLALKTRRPVKIIYSREDSFVDGLNRMSTAIYIKDGVKSDGTLLAREMKMIVNGGGYAEVTPLILRNGSFHASQYRIPNFKWDAYGVYTNEPPCGAYRGFGNTPPHWAVESQMDIIAEKLRIDSVELRKKNIIREGEENLRGEITHSIGAEECLDRAAKWIGWSKPSEKPTGSLRKGKGIALGNKYTMIDVAASATVKVNMDGTVEVCHASDEVGQGCNTLLAQIVAEEFDVPVEKVKVVFGDTAVMPYDSGAMSSKTTLVTGNAVWLACQDAKRQIFELAAPKLGVVPQGLKVKDGKVYITELPERSLPIADLFLPRQPEAGGMQLAALCLPEGGQILGKATYWVEPSKEDPETGQGKVLTTSYCYIVQAAEVAVDIETGVVKVLRFCSAADVGRAVNPKLCECQMDGGGAQGIGNALYEGFVFDDKGKLMNPNFIDYRIPGIVQVPSGDKMGSMVVEAPHKNGPFGAKGMGEAAMTAAAPAIANAIYNAVGVRIMDIPITPERVLVALRRSG